MTLEWRVINKMVKVSDDHGAALGDTNVRINQVTFTITREVIIRETIAGVKVWKFQKETAIGFFPQTQKH